MTSLTAREQHFRLGALPFCIMLGFCLHETCLSFQHICNLDLHSVESRKAAMSGSSMRLHHAASYPKPEVSSSMAYICVCACRDRHENIGRGLIGSGCFQRLMNDNRFVNIPLIMETPMQCAGPKLNYDVSLRDACVAFHETEQEAGECTDKRDVRLLYNMCGKK